MVTFSANFPLSLLAATVLLLLGTPVRAALVITVNSASDGPVQADDNLTLREAIALANGSLSPEQLSPTEASQLEASPDPPQIHFDLPPATTTIALNAPLPAIERPGLVIDGTTQPGYNPAGSATAEIAVPVPVVAIAPAPTAQILRGLTITADNVTVRGLSLYGFTTPPTGPTEPTPPADIFITHRFPEPEDTFRVNRSEFAVHSDSSRPPSGIVIEQNWLGITPDGTKPSVPSAFGVSVFNATGVTIRQNRISDHDGSGIITGAWAENTQIQTNLIVNNGLAGMPDGIRLDGRIANSTISNNLICGNGGSGIFMFKPEGAAAITDNTIRLNGLRLQRAAVYVMGSGHQILNNTITEQRGAGVVVTAFAGGRDRSQGNRIENNRFGHLDGLSIDLNTRRHSTSRDFQTGDGPNPERNSANRRRDTGNAAINAPRFLSPEFFLLTGQVVIVGYSDPGSTVQLYAVREPGQYGPLSEPLATVTPDDTGRFQVESALPVGTVVSAIATDPRYGTSEPAQNAIVQAPGQRAIAQTATPAPQSPCTTPPVPSPGAALPAIFNRLIASLHALAL